MSKDKKKKESKERNTIYFGGNRVKMKQAKEDNKTLVECYPRLPFSFMSSDETNELNMFANVSLDMNLLEYYLSVSREKMAHNEKSGFCREYRNKHLILSTFSIFDNPIETGMRIAYSLISDFICDNIDLDEHMEVPPPVCNVADDIRVDVYIEEMPTKPLYFRLRKDSDPLPGLSRQMSNYVIDNCAAIVRTMCFRNSGESDVIPNGEIENIVRSQKDNKYGPIPCDPSFFWGETKLDVGELMLKDGIRSEDKRLEKWFNALDIRTAIIGDVETMLIHAQSEDAVIFFCGEYQQHLMSTPRFAFRLLDCPKYISTEFGYVVHVITNPYALYHAKDYGITYDDLVNYGLIIDDKK